MSLGINLLLALLWASIMGPFSPANLGVGFVFGYIVLRVVGGRGSRPRYVRQVLATLRLAGFTAVEIVIANVKVAYYTVSRLRNLKPAVLTIPLEKDATDTEVTLLAILVTLTPGTLTLDVIGNNEAMLIHFMHVDDRDEAIREIKQGFERRILEVTR
ncbi:MAG: Na+/H+ antiporter subunit E [Planctomycetota bacterium]